MRSHLPILNRALRLSLLLMLGVVSAAMSFPASSGMTVQQAAGACGVSKGALIASNGNAVGYTPSGVPYLREGATVVCPEIEQRVWDVRRPYEPPAPTPSAIFRAIERGEVKVSRNPREPDYLFLHTQDGWENGLFIGQIHVGTASVTMFQRAPGAIKPNKKVRIGVLPSVPPPNDTPCPCTPQ